MGDVYLRPMASSALKGPAWAAPLLGGCIAAVALLIVVQGMAGVPLTPTLSAGASTGPGHAHGSAASAAAVPLPPAVVSTVGVGSVPVAGVFDPANGYVYVANSGSDSNSVSVVHGTTLVATVSLAANQSGTPLYLVYDRANGYVYVVSRYDGELAGHGEVNILNGTTVLACELYFWARIVHFVAYTLGVSWVRTLGFAGGFVAQMMLAVQLLMH